MGPGSGNFLATSNDNVPNNLPEYLAVSGVSNFKPDFLENLELIAAPCTASTLRVDLTRNVATGTVLNVTLCIATHDGPPESACVPTALSCSITGPGDSCSDLVHTVPLLANDEVAWVVQQSVGGGNVCPGGNCWMKVSFVCT